MEDYEYKVKRCFVDVLVMGLFLFFIMLVFLNVRNILFVLINGGVYIFFYFDVGYGFYVLKINLIEKLSFFSYDIGFMD